MSENLTQQLPDDPLRLILARLDSIDARLTSIEGRLTSLEDRLTSLEDRVTSIEGHITSLEGRMNALEEKVDRRMQETRPIWEAVLKRLDAVEVRMAGLESEVRMGVRQIDRRVEILAVDVLELRGSHHELEGRVDKLEPESKR